MSRGRCWLRGRPRWPGRCSEQAELFHAGGEQLVDQVARQWFIDREVQRSCGALIAGELRRERGQIRAAVRQVAQVILERGKPGDSLAVDLERRHSVGDAFLNVGQGVSYLRRSCCRVLLLVSSSAAR